jgi:flagellum-specific peptidoglycan hydrolase FlgJ
VDLYQTTFLQKASQQAAQAGHVFPDMAACEAALESAYGTSGLAIEGNNCLGIKQHAKPIYDTIFMPTREYINGKYVQIEAEWVKYPTQADCFTDRMDILRRLPTFYGPALNATNAIDYVILVSKHWSTDPDRAAKCIAIYQEWKG